MTPEERTQMERLVAQIQTEKDHVKFLALVQELDTLLARKEQRINPAKTNDQTRSAT